MLHLVTNIMMALFIAIFNYKIARFNNEVVKYKSMLVNIS